MFDDTIDMDPSKRRNPPPSPSREGVPDAIGSYKLLELIGQGGMGEVYLAEQTGAIQRKVALKVIKQGMDTREVVARFEAERQALAMMDHPCIARVFDAGATDQGRPYFVMEYVNGLPITEYCDRHRLGMRDRLKLFARVCDGVQHAHTKAIIHRDLKPHNVLVTVVDDEPVPKIIDFGIAKATGQALTDKTMFTGIGQLIGTPEYMSPEQIEMSGENIDARTDIYSLGVILYELLAGAPPFDPAEFRKEGFDAIRRRIVEQDPARPSTRVTTLSEGSALAARNRRVEPTKLSSALKGDLDWITMKALEKDRTRRYPTANALAEDIQHYLNHEPVSASPPSATYLMTKLVRRHRGAFAALAVILVVLAAASVVTTSLYFKAQSESKRAQVEATRSEQVAAFMKAMLLGVGPSVALGRDTKMLREILDNTTKRVDHDLASQPLVEGEMRSVLASTYSDLGEFPTAEIQQRRALDLFTAQLGERDTLALDAHFNLAVIDIKLGRMEAAESLLVRTGAIEDQVLGPDDPKSLATAAALGGIYSYRGELDKAEPITRRAVDGLRRVSGDADTKTQEAMFTLAGIYTDQFRPASAESLYLILVQQQEREFGPEHPNTITMKVALGWVYRIEKKMPEAEQMTREALAVARRVLGNDHNETTIAMNNLGVIYSDMGRNAEAERLYLENLEIGRRVQGAKHPETIATIVNLASFYEKTGRYRDGEARADESIHLFEGVVPKEFPGRGIAFEMRGLCRAKLGRDAEAEPDLLEANRILLPAFGPEHGRIKELHKALHDLYVRQNKPDEAAKWTS